MIGVTPDHALPERECEQHERDPRRRRRSDQQPELLSRLRPCGDTGAGGLSPKSTKTSAGGDARAGSLRMACFISSHLRVERTEAAGTEIS